MQPNLPSHRLAGIYHKNAEGFLGFELIFMKVLTNEPECINNGAGMVFMCTGKKAGCLNFVFSLLLTVFVTSPWQ